jgi:uncharacterized protein YbgA (DUF1722 family)
MNFRNKNHHTSSHIMPTSPENSPPLKRQAGQPISSMTKFEMEEAIKKYRYVLMKLHKEIESKDEQIADLTRRLKKAQAAQGK